MDLTISWKENASASMRPAEGDRAWRPASIFGYCLVGYFEGLSSERGIAWRAADSLALREFLGLKVSESPPDHSTISRTRTTDRRGHP